MKGTAAQVNLPNIAAPIPGGFLWPGPGGIFSIAISEKSSDRQPVTALSFGTDCGSSSFL